MTTASRKENISPEELPLVSVVMPAWHCAGTIRRAIDSALCQEVPLEILVIDDCSGDLEETIAFYAGDFRVKFIRNEQNLGAAASRNRGVDLARGIYIAFLDADDWWAPQKLKKQIALLEQTGAALCCTARELVTPEGKTTGKVIPVQENITYRQLLHHNSVNCSSVLIPAKIMKSFRMEHEDSHEDYILWLRILKKYQKACGINEPLLKYRLTSGGKSGNKLHSAGMTWKVYRYLGFGRAASLWYFCCYAVHGIWKYRGFGS